MRSFHVEKDKWRYIFTGEQPKKKSFTLQELFERTKTRIAQPIYKLPEKK